MGVAVLPWERFERYLRSRGRSRQTLRTFYMGLQRLARFTDKDFLGDPSHLLTPSDILDFLDDMGEDYASWTLQSTLTAAKAWDKWGRAYGFWGYSGIDAIEAPSVKTLKKPPLSLEQARTLFKTAYTPLRLRLAYCGLLAGCRVSESAAMTLDNLLEDRLTFVGKGEKVREIPLHPALRMASSYFLGPDPIDPEMLHRLCRKWRKEVGFMWTPHSLRRTFSQRLMDAEVPLEIVEALMGHAPSSMTIRAYASIPWRRKDEAINRLDYSMRDLRSDESDEGV